MQIVSTGGNLHKMSKSVFWEKLREYFNMSSAEVFAQSSLYIWYMLCHVLFIVKAENLCVFICLQIVK